MKYITAAYMMIVLMVGVEELSTFKHYCNQDNLQATLESAFRLAAYILAFALTANTLLSIWRDQVVEETWEMFNEK